MTSHVGLVCVNFFCLLMTHCCSRKNRMDWASDWQIVSWYVCLCGRLSADWLLSLRNRELNVSVRKQVRSWKSVGKFFRQVNPVIFSGKTCWEVELQQPRFSLEPIVETTRDCFSLIIWRKRCYWTTTGTFGKTLLPFLIVENLCLWLRKHDWLFLKPLFFPAPVYYSQDDCAMVMTFLLSDAGSLDCLPSKVRISNFWSLKRLRTTWLRVVLPQEKSKCQLCCWVVVLCYWIFCLSLRNRLLKSIQCLLILFEKFMDNWGRLFLASNLCFSIITPKLKVESLI